MKQGLYDVHIYRNYPNVTAKALVYPDGRIEVVTENVAYKTSKSGDGFEVLPQKGRSGSQFNGLMFFFDESENVFIARTSSKLPSQQITSKAAAYETCTELSEIDYMKSELARLGFFRLILKIFLSKFDITIWK